MQWIADLMKQYGQLQIADEAKNLDDNAKVLARDRAAVEAHHRRNFGADYQSPRDADDMIHIGDQVQTGNGISPIVALALGLGLMVTGAGLGAGGAMIAGALQPQQATPPPSPTVTVDDDERPDRDTKFRLELEPND